MINLYDPPVVRAAIRWRLVLRLCLTLAGVVLLAASAIAQDTTRGGVRLGHSTFTTEGREFWVVFQKNFRDYIVDEKTQAQVPAAALELELYIASSQNTKVSIDIPGIDFHIERTVRAGRVTNISIDTAAQLRSSEEIEQLGVHIVSDEPVAVYGLNRRYQTTDTYLAHPVNVLGKVYRAMGYRWLQNDLLSQVAIIATMPNTTVRITPTVTTSKGKPAGVPFTVTLNRGDAYQVIPRYNPATNSDLTGTLIEADKPIAVFSGHNCAYVPNQQTKACNLLVEQLPAVPSWGRQFFVGTLAGRTSAVFRVLASVDSTELFENGRKVATLAAGQFYENDDQRTHTLITASQPVLVAQMSKGYDNGDNVGDPMMIIVSPTEQFLDSYRFATPVRGSWHHYINLIAPTESLADLRLDGNAIEPRKFTRFGLSRYSIGQIEVRFGTHVLEGSEPFGLYSYGFGYDESAYDAYGNGGGQSMDIVVELPDTMAPMLDARLDQAAGRVTAVARDDRVNDRGLAEVVALDYDNVAVGTIDFAAGAPLTPIDLTLTDPNANAYVLFRLTDRAANTSYFTVCVRHDDIGDTLQMSVLPDGRSCDFAPKITFGALLSYSVLTHDVTIPAVTDPTHTPVALYGSPGKPAWGIAGNAEYAYRTNLLLLARAGFDFWRADAFGHSDSLGRQATNGVRINEEYFLHRTNVMLSLGGGVQWFVVDRRAYLFGMLSFKIPVYSSEVLTSTIMSPSSYQYENGGGSEELYNGSGPAGVPLAIAPEAGIGGIVDLPRGWRVFGELGAGRTLTSISSDRDWYVSWLFGRMGVKIKL